MTALSDPNFSRCRASLISFQQGRPAGTSHGDLFSWRAAPIRDESERLDWRHVHAAHLDASSVQEQLNFSLDRNWIGGRYLSRGGTLRMATSAS
jgi:hypothetical protein